IRMDRTELLSVSLEGNDRNGPFALDFRAGATPPYPDRPDRPRRDDFTEEWGFDQPGGDLGRAPAADVAQCQALCADDVRCRAYTFNTRDRLCYLKNAERPLEPRRDCVTGIKRTSARGLSERPGFSIEGGDYTSVYLPTLTACQDACLSDVECLAYTYDTRNRMCYLKDRVGYYAPRDEMVSGVKQRR
ncbi:MAG TPA: PAN/Apple domain-containing protein, partial [Thermoanaerobaculia bacterium]|nr:PAN/Apple domain-containing protein [Thermoanaerobaculia bacterium]